MSEVVDQEGTIAARVAVKSSGPSRAQVAWVIALLAILVVGLASIVVVRATGAKLVPVQQWQYKIVSPSDYVIQEKMNELGKQGWELVFARRAMSGSEYNRTASYEMLFKRPINSKASSSKE
ncbi:MAG: hypothetical protein PF483_06780 [Halothiobacillus sp.]|jgi:hypothetical protein|nr:hypothetical protein [Halothiobacillus sp.]